MTCHQSGIRVLTQSEGGYNLPQRTINLFDDQSQQIRKAVGVLSRSQSEVTFSASRAGESLYDIASRADDGGVDGGNVRFVDGVDGGCVLAWCVGFQGRRGGVCLGMCQSFCVRWIAGDDGSVMQIYSGAIFRTKTVGHNDSLITAVCSLTSE